MSVILGVTFDNDIAYVWLIGGLFCNMSQINRKNVWIQCHVGIF